MRELLFLSSVCILKIPSAYSVPRTFEVAKRMQIFEPHLIRQDATHTNNQEPVFTPNTIESYLILLTLLGQLSLSLTATRSRYTRGNFVSSRRASSPIFFLGFETRLRIFPARAQITLFVGLFGKSFFMSVYHPENRYRHRLNPG
jgi:hypothetical protein